MKGLRRVVLLSILLTLHACTVGSARSFDTRKDLSGLDLAYLRGEVENLHDENTQSADGKLSGWPFWFLPVSLHVESTNSLHRGDLVQSTEEDAVSESPISGFEHTHLRALGFGLLAYRGREATWNDGGELEQWREDVTLAAGLLYRRHAEGEGENADSMSTHVLAGALGYTETNGRGYFKLLWIPIPVRW